MKIKLMCYKKVCCFFRNMFLKKILMKNKQNLQNNIQFIETANNYSNWKMRAEDLKYASQTLDENFEEKMSNGMENISDIKIVAGHPMISKMLKGYAIELFAKTIFIKNGNKVAKVEDGKCSFNLSGANNHNLKPMLEGIDIDLTKQEKNTLDKLSQIVKGFGRYPVLKKASQAPLKDQGNGILGRLSWQEEDDKNVDSLLSKLESKLENI